MLKPRDDGYRPPRERRSWPTVLLMLLISLSVWVVLYFVIRRMLTLFR